MAPKRAAKKAAAPPPPPPPPAESFDSTSSGSEDEEAIAHSPVPAATPALKNAPAPSEKGAESESSEEEEEEEEESEESEEEEEPVRAAPKNQPPPQQKEVDSDASGSDDDDDEEEPTRAVAAPTSAPKKQPPQPEEKEDSDTSGDEGESESEEEEAPPPPPPPKAAQKEAEAPKPPAAAAAATKKPGAAQRIWSPDDEVRILEAIAAHQKEHGAFPQPEVLVDVLAGKLDNPAYGSKELHSKIRSLRTRYLTLSKRGDVLAKEHDRRILDLCKMVWDSDKTTPAAAAAGANAANGHERKGFEEMCELYPYLAEKVKELEAARPGMFKRQFGKIDDDKARAMDKKIKRQRVAQIKLDMRRSDLAKEVTKALIDLVDA